MFQGKEKNIAWLDRPIPIINKSLSIEIFLFAVIILLAIVSRFAMLGDRSLSHDESVHIYYSYLFSEGRGYTHTPLSHGPLQFHLIALLFFLFTATDSLGRVPHAIASVIAIFMIWNWRSYLGRAGAIIAACLMLISPFMLYYGRYARNEAFVVIFGLLLLYAILRYLETGKNRYLYLLTIATVLHFTVKETAFIYTAQGMIFLIAFLIFRISNLPWVHKKLSSWFFGFLVIGVCLTCFSIGLSIFTRNYPLSGTPLPVSPIIPSQTLETPILLNDVGHNRYSLAIVILGIFGGTAIFISGVLLILGFGWRNLRNQRAFDLLILLATFVLPQLTAFPVSWLGWNPLDYHFSWPGWDLPAIFSQTPVRIGIVFLILSIFSIIIGFTWNAKKWFTNALLFWSIYILFFTTIFSNPAGFFTGAIGSLGYWLEQQGVHRGNQPWFYYLFLQIPIYEFLPAFGVITAIIIRLQRIFQRNRQKNIGAKKYFNSENSTVFSLLLFWSVSSLSAFTLAGEKMPWLTVHITLPMILLSGLGLGQLIENINWQKLSTQPGIWAVILTPAFILSSAVLFLILLGITPLLPENSPDQFSNSSYSLFWILIITVCGICTYFRLKIFSVTELFKITTIIAFGYITILTVRTAFRASFINIESASEYLVYAHGASGIKDFLKQIEIISQRTSGGYNELNIAFDAGGVTQGVAWPWKWYMRDFPLAQPFFTVDESLVMSDVLVADPQSFDDLNYLTGENYYQFDSLRMVWPNQDYFDLTWDSFQESLTNKQLRTALFLIWYSRDYSDYAHITGRTSFLLPEWEPSDKMRLYIRKDLAQKVWEYNFVH